MVKINILFFNLVMYHGLNMVCWINNYSVSTSDVELRPIFVALRNITEILSFGFLFRKMHWMSVLGTSWMMLSPSAHPLLPHKEIKMKRWHKHTHTYTYIHIYVYTERLQKLHRKYRKKTHAFYKFFRSLSCVAVCKLSLWTKSDKFIPTTHSACLTLGPFS